MIHLRFIVTLMNYERYECCRSFKDNETNIPKYPRRIKVIHEKRPKPDDIRQITVIKIKDYKQKKNIARRKVPQHILDYVAKI